MPMTMRHSPLQMSGNTPPYPYGSYYRSYYGNDQQYEIYPGQAGFYVPTGQQQAAFVSPYPVAYNHDSSQYNRKRQYRQAAASVIQSLWSGTKKKKSKAQPRPALYVPPGGFGPVAEPNENDVLCGRGGRINGHVGNVKFRDIINEKKKEYLAPTTKKLAKAHIAAAIVNDIRAMDPSGRFLKEDPNTGLWYDIGDHKAIKKTGQALREDAPGIRPDLEDEDDDSSDDETENDTKQSPSTKASESELNTAETSDSGKKADKEEKKPVKIESDSERKTAETSDDKKQAAVSAKQKKVKEAEEVETAEKKKKKKVKKEKEQTPEKKTASKAKSPRKVRGTPSPSPSATSLPLPRTNAVSGRGLRHVPSAGRGTVWPHSNSMTSSSTGSQSYQSQVLMPPPYSRDQPNYPYVLAAQHEQQFQHRQQVQNMQRQNSFETRSIPIHAPMPQHIYSLPQHHHQHHHQQQHDLESVTSRSVSSLLASSVSRHALQLLAQFGSQSSVGGPGYEQYHHHNNTSSMPPPEDIAFGRSFVHPPNTASASAINSDVTMSSISGLSGDPLSLSLSSTTGRRETIDLNPVAVHRGTARMGRTNSTQFSVGSPDTHPDIHPDIHIMGPVDVVDHENEFPWDGMMESDDEEMLDVHDEADL